MGQTPGELDGSSRRRAATEIRGPAVRPASPVCSCRGAGSSPRALRRERAVQGRKGLAAAGGRAGGPGPRVSDAPRKAPAPARRASGSPRSSHRRSPAQRGPAQGPLPEGGSQSLAQPRRARSRGDGLPPALTPRLTPGPQGFGHLSPLTTRSAPSGGGGGGGGGGAARAGSGAAMLGPGLGEMPGRAGLGAGAAATRAKRRRRRGTWRTLFPFRGAKTVMHRACGGGGGTGSRDLSKITVPTTETRAGQGIR